MSGRMLALALVLCLCGGLAAGCAAGLGGQPILVTPRPATPGAAARPAFPATAAPQVLPFATLPGLAPAAPLALAATTPAPVASATPPALAAVTAQALPAVTPQALPTETPQALPAPAAQALPTVTAPALPTAAPQPLPTAAPQVLATVAPAAQTQVIQVPGQPFSFRVPVGWTVQEVPSLAPGMVLAADWTSPDQWDTPPPANVVAHVAAVGAQPLPAAMSDADVARAAQPDQLAAQLRAAMQTDCGPEGSLDQPLPIQIAGRPGMWIHCRATVDGRVMHLAAASAVRDRTALAVMGLAVDPAPWSMLAPLYERIITSVGATD